MSTDTLLEQAEEQAKLKMEVEEAASKYLKIKEMIKDMNEQAKALKEEVEDKFEHIADDEIVAELENGSFLYIGKSMRFGEKLDKDLLSEESQIPKDEMKTAWDIAKLTEQKKLTSEMIGRHTHPNNVLQTKIAQKKKKPKMKKEKNKK